MRISFCPNCGKRYVKPQVSRGEYHYSCMCNPNLKTLWSDLSAPKNKFLEEVHQAAMWVVLHRSFAMLDLIEDGSITVEDIANQFKWKLEEFMEGAVEWGKPQIPLPQEKESQ